MVWWIFLTAAILAGAAQAGPPNDRFVNAIPLSGWVATSTVDPAGAQTETGDPYALNAGVAPAPMSIWWSYTAPADGEATISVTPVPTPSGPFGVYLSSPEYFTIYLYDRTPSPSPALYTSNYFDQRDGGLDTGNVAASVSAVDARFQVTAGKTYWIEIQFNKRTLPFTVKAATSVGRTSWYWQGAQAAGTGYGIEMRGGNLFFGAFIYNDDGLPNWVVASGPLFNGTHFSAPLLQYTGGQSILNPQTPSQVGHTTGSPGTVTIDWTGPCTATMTWPGGTIPISCYVFDPGPGWMNTGKPNGYHDTGWYWLAQDGGGRGIFSQAQGSSEFYAIFHYDQAGKATWHVGTIPNLPTDPSVPFSAGRSNGFVGSCKPYVGVLNLATNLPYKLGYKILGYTGGQTLTGVWKQAQQTSVLTYTDLDCGGYENTSTAGKSSLGPSVYLGPSTELGATGITLHAITDGGVVRAEATTQGYIMTPSATQAGYMALCSLGCAFVRFQF